LTSSITEKQAQFDLLNANIKWLNNSKVVLNKLFYNHYSRFIQEGTWISEDYYDDDKYYNDSLSVMYHSCYPKVAYTINTFEISCLQGYEDFAFELGDQTYVEDGEFFGYDSFNQPNKEKITIMEKSEHLDDPSASSSKV
jgi:hypothetical protein